MAENGKLSSLKKAVSDFVAAINEDAAAHDVEHRIAIVGFASNGDDGWDSDGKWENTGLFVGGELKKYITYTSSGYYEVYGPDQNNTYYIMQSGLFGNHAVKVSYNSQKASWGYWEARLFYEEWVAVTPRENEHDADNSHTQFYEWREGGSQGLTGHDYKDALVLSTNNSIDTAISNLSASGATRASYGMEMANNVFENNALRKGSSRVVVFFTDGEPGQYGYETSEAGRAIAQAHTTKNTHDANVFSVGIFDKKPSTNIGNFMNYVSSNYPNANATSNWLGKWTITSGNSADTKYYMTVENDNLSDVFQTISGSILNPSVEADGETVLTDTLSDYFTFALTEDGKVDVKVYAIDANGNEKESADAAKVKPVVTGKTVTVTDYDFSKHYQGIGDDDEETLVIEIKVKPDTSYTNWGASGEYKTNEGNATVTLPNSEANPIAKAESPKAHVDTYQVTYTFDDTAPDGVNPPEDPKYYISGQQADVKQPEESSVNAGDYTYTFNGWKNGNEDVKGETIPISGNVTLTGSWSQTANTASYTVNYLWNGEQIQAPTTGDNAMHGDKITITDTSIDGYTLIPGQQTSMTIGTGENVLNLNYYKNVTLTANSKTVTYDGQLHNGSPYDCEPLGLLPGHKVKSVDYTCAPQTNVGKYDIELDNAKIITADGADVTDLYQISYNYGKLTINKRSVTLTSESASKVYDGMPLTKHEVKVTGDGFADGEGATYNVTGTITNVGTTDNTFTYTLNEGTKATNYTITKTEGTLTITEASAPTPGTFDFNDVIPDDGKVTPAITKTVKGNVGKNFKEIFAVTVTPKSENAKSTMTPDYYTGEAKVIASKSLKDVPFLFKPEVMANAVVPYGELRFTEAGTYTYTVREVPGGTSRMSYDTTEYTLTIKVVLNENANTYQVESWQFTAGNTPLNIVNTYRTYHPSTPSKPTLNTGDHYAYVMGYPDGTVRPNGSITRAEVSAILFRLLSDETRDEYFTTESSFTDVKAGAWYNNSIATLEKAGVIVDTAKGGAFRPNEAITRAELAAMLAQFSDAKPVKGVKFSDVSAEHWAYEAIAIAAKMGWIEGYPDGTFRPDATITRAEMMTLVNRALERVPSDEDHLLSKRVMLTFPDCKSGDWFYIAVQEATNSHTYERAATEKNGDEQWTALRANRDWTQLEK